MPLQLRRAPDGYDRADQSAFRAALEAADKENLKAASFYRPNIPFTPALTFGGAAVGMTFANQVGRGTRLGNRLFFNLFIQLTAKGSSTGNALVTGLPETANSISNSYTPLSVALFVMSTMSGHVQAYMSPSSTAVTLEQLGTGTVAPLTEANFN